MTTRKRRAATSVDCLLHGHQWHATFVQGSLLCTVCGCKASCPGCTPHVAPMHGVMLVYCAECRLRQSSASEHTAAEQEKGERR